jgi:transcriptional antiterminator RfaH
MESNVYRWYPVYTHPRAEKSAYQLLLAKGITSYLPLRKELRQWSDRKKWVEEPLLKSYLFVWISAREYSEVLMTKGLCRFIYFSGKIASVPERHIENLRLLLASEAELEVTGRKYKKGENVEVIAGPLMGLRGELIEVYSQKRLLVRLGDTGQSLLVHIPAVFLSPLVNNAVFYSS